MDSLSPGHGEKCLGISLDISLEITRESGLEWPEEEGSGVFMV